MQAFTETKFKRSVKKCYDKVFITENPYEAVFRKTVQERLILGPVNDESMRMFVEALFAAARKVGDITVYMTILERWKKIPSAAEWTRQMKELTRKYGLSIYGKIPRPTKLQEDHWILESNYPNDYWQLDVALDRAIYSPKGIWGTMISHSDHVVLGGTKEFMEEFKSKYTEYKKGLDNFLKYWIKCKANPECDTKWIKPLLRNIYGILPKHPLLKKL